MMWRWLQPVVGIAAVIVPAAARAQRATIVGETTGGGANPGRGVPLPHDLIVFVPTGRAINPITKTNWEGVGVKPDVAVPAADALDAALRIASQSVK